MTAAPVVRPLNPVISLPIPLSGRHPPISGLESETSQYQSFPDAILHKSGSERSDIVKSGQNEKLLKEHGDKVPEDKKGAIDSLIADAKKALESNDAEQMKAAIEKITSDPTVQEVVSAMYAQEQEAGEAADAAQAGPAPSAGDGVDSSSDGKGDDDNVVDADFEVVDDEKEK